MQVVVKSQFYSESGTGNVYPAVATFPAVCSGSGTVLLCEEPGQFTAVSGAEERDRDGTSPREKKWSSVFNEVEFSSQRDDFMYFGMNSLRQEAVLSISPV